MATANLSIRISSKDVQSFDDLVMEAIGNIPNFATSINGNTAHCDEITAPTVGMGFNTWQRGRAYTVLSYDENDSTVYLETTIHGITGGAYNAKYAREICEMLASKITFADSHPKTNTDSNSFSAADELLKFKKLLDEGIISQEEFDKKKDELLNQKKEIHNPYTSNEPRNNQPIQASSTGGCYVATCIYGSYDCPEVWVLRRYRDSKLAQSWRGRVFIRTYYFFSPTIVKLFGHTKWFHNMWKPKLDKMVSDLRSQGMEDTPYHDKDWNIR